MHQIQISDQLYQKAARRASQAGFCFTIEEVKASLADERRAWLENRKK